VYAHPTNPYPATIATAYDPKGLIFFQNDMGSEAMDEVTTNGVSHGIGLSDDVLDHQYLVSAMEISQPSFSVHASSRCFMGSGSSAGPNVMGSMEAKVGGLPSTAPNYARDTAKLIAVTAGTTPTAPPYRPQIYRRQFGG
jgi:hypothetical protein